MQLIDTDTDIGVQVKMSTIQQESLEKFSVIEDVRDNISDVQNGNDECVKNHDVADFQKKVDVVKLIVPNSFNSQEHILSEKMDNESNKLSEILHDEESANNEKNRILDNCQNVEIDHKAQEIGDSKDTPDEEHINGESNSVSISVDNSEKVDMSNDNYKLNFNVERGHNNRVSNEVEKLKVSDSEIYVKTRFNETSEIEDKIKNQQEPDITVNVAFDEQDKMDSSVLEYTTKQNYKENEEIKDVKIKQKEQDDVSSVTENNSGEQIEDIEMSVKCGEQYKVKSFTEENNSHLLQLKENEIEDKVMMDVTPEKQNIVKNVSVTKDDKLNVNQGKDLNEIQNNDECSIEMDVTFEEQDEVIISDTEDEAVTEFGKNSEIEDKSNNKINDNVFKIVDNKISQKEQDEMSSVTEDAIEKQIKDCDVSVEFDEQYKVKSFTEENNSHLLKLNENEIVDNVMMDVTLEKQNSLISVTKDDKSNVNQDKSLDEMQNNDQESIEMDVTLVEQNEVIISDTEDEVLTEVEKSCEMKDKSINKISDNELKILDIKISQKEQNEMGIVTNDIIEKQIKNIDVSVELDKQNKVKNLTEKNISQVNELNENETKDNVKMDVTLEKQNNVKSVTIDVKSDVNQDKVQNDDEENIEMDVAFEEQAEVILSNIENKFVTRVKGNSNIDKSKNEINCSVSDCTEEQDNQNTNISNKVMKEDKNKTEECNREDDDELKSIIVSEICDKLQPQDQVHDKHEIKKKMNEHHKDPTAEAPTVITYQKNDQDHNENIGEQNIELTKVEQLSESAVTINSVANRDEKSLDACESIQYVNNEEVTYEIGLNSDKSEGICQEVEKTSNKNEKTQDFDSKMKTPDERMFVNTEHKTILNDSDSENTNTSKVIRMGTDEVIDIPDEKDEDIREDEIKLNDKLQDHKVGILEEKSESEHKIDATDINNLASAENKVLNDKTVPDLVVQDTNVEQTNEKIWLTHISKLSNTLDILSDEEDKPNLHAQEEEPSLANQCTSINLDDDDDVMLIDEEPSLEDAEKEAENISQLTDMIPQKEECIMESEDKKEQPLETAEHKKDSTPTEVASPSTDEKKSSVSEIVIKTEVSPEVADVPKKPLVHVNFLKTYKKNLANMTRDDLEEFCILKIAQAVVDRSNLSDIKCELKSLVQTIDEYKNKSAQLMKQNRDLQVVLKSVQEEQKKKSTMSITPLKITRSVGMQVLMNEKVPLRKKIQGANTTQTNAPNNAANRQGKAAQNQTKQKANNNATNNSTIPVPRLVPAMGSNNLNAVKVQSFNANAPAKPPVIPVSNSLTQSVANGLSATPIQRPEKRPLSRMQNNSFTVDLTDDEPPTKIVSKNVTTPVRLVPPQNLLAPNRQPFGANVSSSPRKVYIPISGSQNQVRPGQTIMLKSVSAQGMRQRIPTAVGKSNPNTIRMHRVPTRHPAPLPDSGKQYQPLNWKPLPPAPDLKLSKVDNGIVVSWNINTHKVEDYEEVASYQLYAYQETSSPPSTSLWKKIGDVTALPLPMACTLTQFMAGYKYYFAVRPVDVRSRVGPFSLPGSILLLNKM